MSYPIIMNGDHAEYEAEHANTPPEEDIEAAVREDMWDRLSLTWHEPTPKRGPRRLKMGGSSRRRQR